MYGEICSDENDCKNYGLTLVGCVDGECKCKKAKQFSQKKLTCLNSSKGIKLI